MLNLNTEDLNIEQQIALVYSVHKKFVPNTFIVALYKRFRDCDVFKNMELVEPIPAKADSDKVTYIFEIFTEDLLDQYAEATIDRVQKTVLGGVQKVKVTLPIIIENIVEGGFYWTGPQIAH